MSAATIKISQDLPQIFDRLLEDLRASGSQPDVAASLFVWTEGRASYIANCDRREIIDVLEAMIARWKEGMPDIPAHLVAG